MGEIDITQEIKNVLYDHYPDMIDEIKRQPNAESEIKRFVSYVVENTGCFGHMIFMTKTAFREEMKRVDWRKVVT